MKKYFLITGFIFLGLAWLGPLPSLAKEAFFAHMTMHMCVVAVAAPLIAFGMMHFDLKIIRQHPKWFAPIPASIAELIVVWGWHAPGLHHVARGSLLGLILEQALFFITGLWLWLSSFVGNKGAGILGLLLTSMHMTLLGALLALAPRSLYSHHNGFAGMSALDDQHFGGAIMLLVGGIVYLLGGLILTSDLLRENVVANGVEKYESMG